MADNEGDKKFQGNKPKGGEHAAAVALYRAEHGREARKRKAVERHEARALRGTAEQMKLLDQRLGESVGAKRERLRLIGK